MNDQTESWDLTLESESHWWELGLKDVWAYRDLLWLFVRRDIVSVYKQTVLGPLWFFIQPLLTTIVFTIIFSGVAKIPTGGLPPMLFYLAGVTPWNYFAACLNKTSSTFTMNAAIFGKVYFPRMIVPMSVVISNCIQFVIQLALFLGFFIYYYVAGAHLTPHWVGLILLMPCLLILMAAMGLGAGIIISSLTTKYRDFTFLVAFGLQLAMYATPVIYPLSQIPEKYRWIIQLNPMSGPIEAFRALFLGGNIPWHALQFSMLTTSILVLAGIILFNRVEKSFMDTV
jgi:lipopolysaccharide transport system permease protein